MTRVSTQIESLLIEMLETGGTVDDHCQQSPELRSQLAVQFRKLRAVENEIDLLFPLAPSSVRLREAAPITGSLGRMPNIPGHRCETMVARGGMGVVYKAWQENLHRSVAVKMLLTGAYSSQHELSRFQREAESVASLQHPHIVAIFDIGEVEGIPYFTMEWMEGGTLAARIHEKPLPVHEASELLVTLARTIHIAHQRGVIHRDLKPANILLNADGLAKISDFGLARRLSGDHDLTLTGTWMGTPCYMAPELLTGDREAVQPAVDIYALGAILHELLTGHPPLNEDRAREKNTQPRASHAQAILPRDLQTIVLKCLESEPARRYATAAALADDLERFLRHEPIHARPISRLERTIRWARRKPSSALFTLSATLLMLLAFGVSVREFHLSRQHHQSYLKWKQQLASIAQMPEEQQFRAADRLLEQIPGFIADELQADIARVRSELNLVQTLDSIRLKQGEFVQNNSSVSDTGKLFEAAFRQSHLGAPFGDVEKFASAIRSSPVQTHLLSALDDWAADALESQRDWLYQVARAVDPDPWRDQVRNPSNLTTLESVQKLAASADLEHQPGSLLLGLARNWKRLGGNPIGFLEKAQQHHPNDFWLNAELGYLFGDIDPSRAIGYCRAALAIRPNAASVIYNLSIYHTTLGMNELAMHYIERVLELDPNDSWNHCQMSHLLIQSRRFEEAMKHARIAIRNDPEEAWARRLLREIFLEQRQLAAARKQWEDDLINYPADFAERDGYAELCLFDGDTAEYERSCEVLLSRFAMTNDAVTLERIGKACILRPTKNERLRRAAEVIDRSWSTDRSASPPWVHPYMEFTKALAEYRMEQFESAAIRLEGPASSVMGAAPQLLRAMCLHRLGKADRSQALFQQAIQSAYWAGETSFNRDRWIILMLRSEAEQLIGVHSDAFVGSVSTPNAQ